MSSLSIPTAEVFEPLLYPSRYKAAYGGRGSGKSHFFADLLVDQAMRNPGLRGLCLREIQKSLKESAKRLIEDKIQSLGFGQYFEVQTDQIKTPGGGVILFQGLQDHTAESIKSFEGFDIAWCEEAQTISASSLNLLRPTIRKEGSELWFSWNPRRKSDPVDKLFRAGNPTNAIIVRANWDANPWFPSVLEQERIDCLRDQPDQYDHIWEGGYATVLSGAYYAMQLALCRKEGRIATVPKDPLMTIRAYWDIGGTGMKADATAIWICQFVGHTIRFLDYYEARHQPLEVHLQWLRDHGWGKAQCILPHDGAQGDKIYSSTYEGAIRQAGFDVRVIKNQGVGAAKLRIEAARRLFPAMHFNAATCEPGLDALGWYHEKIDEDRQYGLGVDHDWSSHCADAFGLAAVDFENPMMRKPVPVFKPRGVI